MIEYAKVYSNLGGGYFLYYRIASVSGVDRFGLGPCPRGIRTAAQPHRFDIGIDRVGLGSYPRGIRTHAAAMGTPIFRIWADAASDRFL